MIDKTPAQKIVKNTIDDLVKILQSAKEEIGGEFYFCIYYRRGQSIKAS